MTTNLSEFQQKRKAEAIVERLALQENLNSTRGILEDLFKDKPILVADLSSKEELGGLISEIKAGTANNHKIARFLELAGQLAIG